MSRTSQILTISWEGIRVEIWFDTNSGFPSIRSEDRLSDSSSDDSHPDETRGCSSRSSASLGCVADLVFWHLPVRTLVQCKILSKEWRAWCDENLLQIAKERRKAESNSDWYFPLAFENRTQHGLPGSWKWHGMHQGTMEQHTLPGLDFLPKCFSHRNGAPRFDYVLEAVSSGLLVLSKWSPHDNNFVLIVCNPLSKKWKMFPIPGYANCQDRSWVDPERPRHTHLVLGDVPNEYRVIRVSNFCVNVYSSSTERWVCAPYNRPYIGFYYSSSVCFQGHVYILKMMEGVRFSGTFRRTYNLRIYDIESGRYENKSLASSTVLTQDCNEKNEVESPRDPILVVCMGNLYAVAASCRARRNLVKRRRRRETYVANCEFHIFTLMEEGKLLDVSCKHLVTIPVVLSSLKQDVVEFWNACRNFSCVARSNMICLAWSSRHHHDLPVNYLEYDVVSGFHTTYSAGAHHRQPFSSGCHTGMAYTPCLDLEP